ncbi:MAG: hypothetical protein LBT71_08175 [Azoarcus sp.]|nr:hypothetical protein [Azoarcus sp.]
MKKILAPAIFAVLSSAAVAADSTGSVYLDFQNAVEAAVSDGKLDGSIKYYLRGQTLPGEVKETFPETADKKQPRTQGLIAGDCRDALLRVLASFEEEAKKFGANAVIDIVSFYGQNHYASPTKVWCNDSNRDSIMQLRGKPVIVK